MDDLYYQPFAMNVGHESIYTDKTCVDNSPISTYEMESLLNNLESLADLIDEYEPKHKKIKKIGNGKYA